MSADVLQYDGGIDLGDGARVGAKTDRDGDSWLYFGLAGESHGGNLGFYLDPDQLREMAGALKRAADAAETIHLLNGKGPDGR